MTSPQKRKHPRYAVEASIEIRGSFGVVEGRTRNISRGGLAAHLRAPLDPGAEVEVAMALVFDEATFSEPLRLPARAVWSTPLGEERYQVGLSLLPLAADQAEFLDMFLRYLGDGQTAARGGAPATGSGGGLSF